jgi:hypothetical protein
MYTYSHLSTRCKERMLKLSALRYGLSFTNLVAVTQYHLCDSELCPLIQILLGMIKPSRMRWTHETDE